ncbi:Ig-like domain-containing protein [Paenibacillus sp. DMB20]|uniref:Ig-like domain-containing protein n=1 Tax=Paenibacillus sp. DMB20 TaxID=1642570 RepID=UPI00062821EC|nr:Ig-like domain-containing protein [Paenibacillus sp. DMB20]KKO53860.1 fibronectin [Paenibacillus sp. DMB20]
MLSRLRKYGLLCMVAVLVAACLPSPPAKAAAQITIDSHQEGQIIAPGMTELQGTYSGVYDIELIVNGITMTDVLTDDPNGDDGGTWSFKLDTTKMDGTAEVVLKAKDAMTRYGVWSPFIHLNIDNPEANIPLVQITIPAENTLLKNKVNVIISVEGKNSIELVQLRINGGEWQPARPANSGYIYSWDTRQAANRVHSLEARATDIYGNTGYSLTVYASTGSRASISQDGNEAVSDHIDVENPLKKPSSVTDSVYAEPAADTDMEASRLHDKNPLLPEQDRAIWIWENASYPLVLNPNARHVLSSMAKDTSTFNQRPITTLYLGVDQYHGANMLEDYRTEVRHFVEWAHNEGFSVQALIAGGTKPPYFGAYSRYHAQAVREFEKVLNYNLASPESARFDGVNLDTEPYILPDFKTAKPSVQVQYLDMLKLLMERKQASGLTLPVGAAIPRWYDTSPDAADIPWNGETKWLSEHIQDTADYISIMDYRDQADGSAGIIAHAMGELAYASRIGKPKSVVIGVETKDIADGGDPETISFHEEGRCFMEQELKKVYAAFPEDPAFGGVALHHYSSLLDFPSEWGPAGFKWAPPADREPPGVVSGAVTATAFDFQRIDITYGMAQDNGAVNEYRIYRGTEPAFEVGPETYAGSSEGLVFKDKGLLPDTTYYYKITAVDVSGNEGLPSEAVSAVTAPSTLKPMIIGQMDISYAAGKASVTLQVVDMETKAPVPANVSGRFTHMAGRYVHAMTNAEGFFQSQSEQVSAAQGEIGFLPRRIMADSYYWASAYDQTPYPTAVWSP